MNIDLEKGVDNLLIHGNIDILNLLLRDGCVDISFMIERAKPIYAARDDIDRTVLMDLFDDFALIDSGFAQIFLELLFRSTGYNYSTFAKLPIDVVKKLMSYGAVIPSEANYLSKLPYDDFIEQIELTNMKIDFELEAECIKFSTIEVLKWVRKNSCESADIITKLFLTISNYRTDEKRRFYFDEAKNDNHLTDDLIMAIIYKRAHDFEATLNDHIINIIFSGSYYARGKAFAKNAIQIIASKRQKIYWIKYS